MSTLVPGHDPLPTAEAEEEETFELPETPEHWTDAQNSSYSRMFDAIYENERVIDAVPTWGFVAHIIASISAEMLDPNSKDMMFYDSNTQELIGQIKMQERTLS